MDDNDGNTRTQLLNTSARRVLSIHPLLYPLNTKTSSNTSTDTFSHHPHSPPSLFPPPFPPSKLSPFLPSDSSLGVDGSTTGLAVRPQSALVALLSRLLPVIESFFLVHVGDIFNAAGTGGALPKVEEVTSAANANATGTTGAGPSPGVVAATSAVTTSVVNGAGSPPPAAASPGPATAGEAATSTASASTPAPAATSTTTPASATSSSSSTSMPGERYRSTTAYAALNLSLLPPDVLAAIGHAYGASPPSSPHGASHTANASATTITLGGGSLGGGQDPREGGDDHSSSFAATVFQLTSLQRSRSLRATSSSFSSSSGPQFLALPHSSSASTLMGLAGTSQPITISPSSLTYI